MNNVLAKVVDWVIILMGNIAFDTFKNTSRLNSWRGISPHGHFAPVTSSQRKVISPHNRSHFAPYKSHFAPCRSYFAPCKKLVKFAVNFSFSTDFELDTTSSRVRLNMLDNTEYHFVQLFPSTQILSCKNKSVYMLSRLCLFDTFLLALISLCPPHYADVVDKVKQSRLLIYRWL